MQTQAGDDLIQRILAHSADDAILGQAANELLSALFQGYPVEKLGILLRSGDDSAVQTATWILSELGDRAAPLVSEIPALLAHHLVQVRYFAIEVALVNAEDAATIADVLRLSEDPEQAVRWKVLEFLSGASTEQLAAGAVDLEPGEVKEQAGWLARLDDEDEPGPREILARLEGPVPLTRLFAAAAAVRLAEDGDLNLLRHAVAAEDEEISSFARERLERQQGRT